MSSFKDTFTKDQKKESLLKYDATASLFFLATVLVCVALPWTYSLLYNAMFPANAFRSQYTPVDSKKGTTFSYCQCTSCASKYETALADSKKFSNRFTRSFFIQLFFVVALWVGVAFCGFAIAEAEENIASFDPFKILGLSSGASDREIKRAYRTLSLKWHPDRNPNSPQAEHEFLMIAKAHLALTDEVARANYEKYGNPDGPSSMKIGIGLPPFLVAEENQLIVLLTFFVSLLIVAPMALLSYYQRTKRVAANGLQHETIHLLSELVTKETRGYDYPQILAASAESRELTCRPEEDDIITQIAKEVREPAQRKFKTPIVTRNYFLTLAHLHRMGSKLTEKLNAEIKNLIPHFVEMMTTVVDIAVARRTGNFPAVAFEAVNFRRQLIQAVAFGAPNASLLQAPHVTGEIIENYLASTAASSKAGIRQPITTLGELISRSSEERKLIFKEAGLSDNQIQDIENFCDHVTDMEVFASVETTGEKAVVQGDVSTFNIRVVRRNVPENFAQGPVHAPFYPKTKFEELFVFLIDEKDQQNPLAGFVKIKGQERDETCKIQMQMSKSGPQNFRVLVFSDSYTGVDKDTAVTVNVLTPEASGRKVIIHKEDQALDQEPTLFEQFAGLSNEKADSDDEEEEVIDGGKATRVIQKKKKVTDESEVISDDEEEDNHPKKKDE